MSTIFGIFQRDAKPVMPADIKGINEAMDHWEADDKGLYVNDEIVLGNLLLHNTPESMHEKLPFENEAFCITADARIDNREEILLLLSEFEQVSETSPDSLLILYLYEKFGENCLKYLEGDFAFVILEKKSRQIFCARDQLGVKPFFYFLDDDLFIFSSEKKGILAIDRVNKDINEKFVLQLMADIEPALNETFHTNIHSLLPANQIKINKSSSSITNYWRLELPPLLKLKNKQEYVDRFRSELSRAVKVRLRSVFPVGAQLSGGLDSSAITGIAASLIQEKSHLYTFSYVLPENNKGKKDYEDEEQYIDQVVKFNAIEHSIRVRKGDWNNFLEPHDIVLDVQNGVEAYNSWWQEPLRKAISENKVRVILSGFPGDEAISNKGMFYFHDLLSEGEYLDFLKIAFKKKQYSLPFRKIARKILPENLITAFNKGKTEQSRRVSFLKDRDLDIKLWKDFRNTEQGQYIYKSHKEHMLKGVTRAHTSLRMQWENSFCIRHKIEPRFPFADIRLIRFFLSIPSNIIGHPNIDRYMFRNSMEGLMPESIRWRFDKSRAPYIFYWIENREYANSLHEWLLEQKKHSFNSILKNLDIEKIVRGFDKNNPDNYKDGLYTPGRQFQMEVIMYFFSKNCNE